jgi:hypothetical protein
MLFPWKFRPAEYDHRLTLVGNMFSDPAGESVIVPTNGTFTVLVEQRVSNLTDAVFLDAPEVQHSSFGDVVSVDVGSSNTGTSYPVGTKPYPVNNMADALAIAVSRGLSTFYLLSDLTLTGIDVSDYVFLGVNHNITLTVDVSADTEECGFQNLMLEGTLSGQAHIRDCYVGDLSNVHGHITDSLLNGLIELSGLGSLHAANCKDGFGGFTTPVIDCAGSGSELLVTDYFGGLTLRNKTGAEDFSLNVSSARIVLENTVTNGSLIVRGVGQLTDNSAGATVDSSGLVNAEVVAEAVDLPSLKNSAILLETEVNNGSTPFRVSTPRTEPDDYWVGANVLVEDTVRGLFVPRRVSRYDLTDGSFRFSISLGFTPTLGAKVIVLSNTVVANVAVK